MTNTATTVLFDVKIKIATQGLTPQFFNTLNRMLRVPLE
jgi:hypothetical protein